MFYRDSILLPFFRHYLKGGPDPNIAKVTTFATGANRWRRNAVWPPREATSRALYLHAGGNLAFEPPPPGRSDADQYWSDPARPVPFIDWIAPGMPQPYLTADQRFASRRTDVLTYQTDVLPEDVPLAGPLTPVLHVATTGTDADFVVKLIDVFPDSMPLNPQGPGWSGGASGERRPFPLSTQSPAREALRAGAPRGRWPGPSGSRRAGARRARSRC